MTVSEEARRLFDQAPCGLLTARLDGIVTEVNETFLQWSGYTREEVVGRYFLDRLSRASKLFFETRFVPMLQNTGQAREIALQLQRPDGSILDLFVNARYERGPESLIRLAVFDATTRLDYERLLLEHRRRAESAVEQVRILQEAAEAAALATTEEQLTQAVIAAVTRATDAGQVSVTLCGQAAELPPPGSPERVALDQGHPVQVTSRRMLVEQFPPVAAAAPRLHACAVVPVSDDAGRHGVISCGFSRSRELSEPELTLLQALAALMAPVLRRLELQREVQHLALHDRLTGITNRLGLEQSLERTLARLRRVGGSVGLVFFDLDGFKRLNDERGHAMGDRALREIAQRVGAVLRTEDVFGRLGGDEFLVICEAGGDALQGVAERVRDAARWGAPDEAGRLRISASVGITEVALEPAGEPAAPGEVLELAERMLQRADEAMYLSKQRGGGQITRLDEVAER